MPRSLVMEWRDAVRDSDLPASVRLVAFALSTRMSSSGNAYPSKERIAADCGLSKRTVDVAIDRLEGAGLLSVSRSKGRSSNRYQAIPTLQELQGSENANDATGDIQPCNPRQPTVQPLHPKAVEIERESVSGKERRRATRSTKNPTPAEQVAYLGE